MTNQVTTLRMEQKFKKTPAGEIPIDWDVRSLGALAKELINGGTPDTKIEKYWRGEIPWITGADFLNQKIGAIRRWISKEAVENSATNIVPKGAVLVVTRTGVGKLAIAPFPIAISQDITGVLPDTEQIIPEYLFWSLNLRAAQLRATHQGTSISGILRSDLETFPIALPPLHEQKRIAEILSAADDVIQRTRTALAKLAELRAAILQGFFGPFAQNRGARRKWKILPLIDVATLQRGVDLPVQARRSGNVPVYGSNGILGHHDQTEFQGPGVITGRSGTIGQVYYCAGPYWPLNTTLHVVDFHGNNPRFVALLLDSLKLERFAASTGVPSLNRNFVHPVQVAIPPVNEQERIVEIALQLDDEIAAEEALLGTTSTLHKGLLQVLLSGKVRV